MEDLGGGGFGSELTKNAPPPPREIGTSHGELCHGMDWYMKTTALSPRIPPRYYISSASNFNTNQNRWERSHFIIFISITKKNVGLPLLLNLQQFSIEMIPANHTIRRGSLSILEL